MKQNKDTFLLVMPSFNEEGHIKQTLASVHQIIKSVPGSEILIVDANSTDKTAQIINNFSKKNKGITIIQKERGGYGKDLLHGYNLALKTRHTWIFQTDSDFPFDPSDFLKLWAKRDLSPLILGFRKRRNDPFYRTILAWVIEVAILLLTRKFIKDSNIPFRLIKSDYLKRTLKKIPPATIAPNIFLSILASTDGHHLQHIPVSHYSRNKSKNAGRIARGALQGILELVLFICKNNRTPRNS